MGIILILVLGALVSVSTLVLGIVLMKKTGHTDPDDCWQPWLTIFGAVGVPGFLIPLLIVIMVVPVGKLHTAAELEAFFDSNAAVYEAAVERTESMLTIALDKLPETALIPVQGSVEKLELGKATAQAIDNWKLQVAWYNAERQWYLIADESWLIGSLYPTLDSRLVAISLQ